MKMFLKSAFIAALLTIAAFSFSQTAAPPNLSPMPTTIYTIRHKTFSAVATVTLQSFKVPILRTLDLDAFAGVDSRALAPVGGLALCKTWKRRAEPLAYRRPGGSVQTKASRRRRAFNRGTVQVLTGSRIEGR